MTLAVPILERIVSQYKRTIERWADSINIKYMIKRNGK